MPKAPLPTTASQNPDICLANEHPRVQILSPGIGVGGHCIPIDPWFLVNACPDISGLLRAARDVNDGMPLRTANLIRKAVADLENPRIVCLGATYKPNVRDLRESPALEVFEILRTEFRDLSLVDPLIPAMRHPRILTFAPDIL